MCDLGREIPGSNHGCAICRYRHVVRVIAATLLLAVAAAVAGCGGSDDEASSTTTAPAAATETAATTDATTDAATTDAATTTSEDPATSPFAYDRGEDLAFRDAGRVNRDYPIAVRDVSFLSNGLRVQGYLAVPPGGGRRPAAIFLHGAGGDRSQLLLQAVWLAGRGAVTLTLTAPSTTVERPANVSAEAALRGQHELAVRDVVAVRRAVDVLSARSDVDPERMGLLGWSLGGRTGAVVAGVEPRIGVVVLMSAGASPVEEYAAEVPRELRADVRRLLGEVDPLRHVARARADTLLLQNGRRDDVVPREALEALAAAAPPGTTVRWYDAGHGLNVEAQREQLDWLAGKLEIRGAPVRGARTGP